MKTLFALFVALSMMGCSEVLPVKPPAIKSEFKTSLPKRARDLRNKFGDQIAIKRGADTLLVDFKYDKKTKYNHILMNDDTIFSGIVSKFKHTYFLRRPVSETADYIHAIHLKNGIVKGLGYEFEQMLLVDAFFEGDLHKDPIKRKCAALIEQKDSSKIVLKTDKRLVASLFNNVLQSLKGDTLISLVPVDHEQQTEDNESATKVSEDVFEVYSRPAQKEIVVKMLTGMEAVSCRIVTVGGQVVFNKKLYKAKEHIHLDVKPGFYIVNLFAKELAEPFSIKLYLGK